MVVVLVECRQVRNGYRRLSHETGISPGTTVLILPIALSGGTLRETSRTNRHRQFGYQLTFFRFGVRGEIESGGNPWQVRDLYMAHFTVTEVEENNFSVAERISRAGPGLAGARTDRMEVWIFNWSAVMRDSVILLEARDGALELNLTLTPVKPLVFHGDKWP